ncbi:MAG: anaerobic ribonucleoside-triphosphate reductase activating protein [Elusimicrobia bacterium CG11_big_fil_rev_8_21_14_0_20_64_6]|nr:MAG: anaerobic ribonucleoside-triphosphate reductase activating protein [Elusimicrobia bacterium CG11_big_fil_rev_8_21_14_0_20_64_6]
MKRLDPADITGTASLLRLGGLTPLSTTDYPGVLSAVLFCQGCPWRCSYCHNSHLIAPGAEPEREWAGVRAFLLGRKGLLDAVVFSGGEPTLQEDLLRAMREVKDMGFLIGLHTGGAYPERLAPVLPLVDWVGLDIKAHFARYEAVNGVPGSGAKAEASLRLVVESGVDHECRTTVHPALLSEDELLAMSATLFDLGARRHVLQAFRPDGCRDEALIAAHDPVALTRLLDRAAAASPRVEIRGI